MKRTAALFVLALSFALLAASCGGGSSAKDHLQDYLGQLTPEQAAYRHAQNGAISALDLVDSSTPSRGKCLVSARMMGKARDDYGKLSQRLRKIAAPDDLKNAHTKLILSLQLYSRYFDQLQQVIGFCDESQLMAASTSTLPDRANALRAQWRVAVLGSAAKDGVEVPHWTREVGRK